MVFLFVLYAHVSIGCLVKSGFQHRMCHSYGTIGVKFAYMTSYVGDIGALGSSRSLFENP